MAKISVNAQRFDPYKNFKFRVKRGGKLVTGGGKAMVVKRASEVVKQSEGGELNSKRESSGHKAKTSRSKKV